MTIIPELARAKINLSLRVLARRADGYHTLQSLVTFADIGDELTLAPGPGLTLTIDGPFAGGLSADTNNLVLRAAELFLQTFPGTSAGHFTLSKTLPVASGIGGGSADAAATLRCLTRANESHNVADEALQTLAVKLGADVPVCLLSRPCFMTGIGETIHDIAATPPIPAVLVNPGTHLATRDVFAALALDERPHANAPALPTFTSGDEFRSFVRDAVNDLEAPATALAPQIRAVRDTLAALPGCWAARMSGSGATCFALFNSEDDAVRAAGTLARPHPDWWVRAALLG